MKTAIIVPARYGSTRFPGKPLALLAGKPMLQHVVEIGLAAANGQPDTAVIVTSDDDRILTLAQSLGVQAIKTAPECPTGSDRVMAAVQQMPEKPEIIVNLQGDAPLCPPDFVTAVIRAFQEHPGTQVATVATQLSWPQLDSLRSQKQTSPFSGTTLVRNAAGQGVWFSKNIIPAIRKEDRTTPHSPILRHIGLYGYTLPALQKFLTWPEGTYEKLEGLEQLRFLENGTPIHVSLVDYKGRPSMSGVDSPEDLARAEKLLAETA